MVILMYSSLYFSICFTYRNNNQSFWTKAIFCDFPGGLVVKTMFQCRGAGLNPSGEQESHMLQAWPKNYFSDTVWAVYGTIESIRIALAAVCLNNSETFRYFTQKRSLEVGNSTAEEGVSIISQTARVLSIFYPLPILWLQDG